MVLSTAYVSEARFSIIFVYTNDIYFLATSNNKQKQATRSNRKQATLAEKNPDPSSLLHSSIKQ
jgi:hypothetical protein